MRSGLCNGQAKTLNSKVCNNACITQAVCRQVDPLYQHSLPFVLYHLTQGLTLSTSIHSDSSQQKVNEKGLLLISLPDDGCLDFHIDGDDLNFFTDGECMWCVIALMSLILTYLFV